MTQELLPCPFCGGANIKVLEGNFHGFFPSCKTCYFEYKLFGSHEEAITGWNTRALPKMQKVDLDGMLKYQRRSQFFEEGYRQAIDDIKSKYGELYAEVK